MTEQASNPEDPAHHARPVVYRKAKPVYVTVKAAAQYLDVSTMTIHRRIRDGQLKAIRIGRSVRISIAELKRFEADAEIIIDTLFEEEA